jgi:hypothetical protein
LSGGPNIWYRIHGLLVESEIPFSAQPVDGEEAARTANPGPRTSDGAARHYQVIEGEPRECPPSPPPGRLLGELREHGFAYWSAETRREPPRWTLRYTGVCDVTLDCGAHTITVHRAPEADPGMVPVFLEGSVLAHAATAEGLLVLHASAVEVDGRALAIVGAPGAGKSTLAALLCAAGARLVADDALRVDATGNGAVCFPGTRSLRLRPAAANLATEIEGAVEVTADGRTAVLPTRPAAAPLELAAVLVPELSQRAARLEVRRLGAMEGLQELLRYPRLTMWRAREPIAQLFELTAGVAAELPVYRATLTWDPPCQPRLAERLLAGLQLGAPSQSGRPQQRHSLDADGKGHS